MLSDGIVAEPPYRTSAECLMRYLTPAAYPTKRVLSQLKRQRVLVTVSPENGSQLGLLFWRKVRQERKGESH